MFNIENSYAYHSIGVVAITPGISPILGRTDAHHLVLPLELSRFTHVRKQLISLSVYIGVNVMGDLSCEITQTRFDIERCAADPEWSAAAIQLF